jgi:hypothetical protein
MARQVYVRSNFNALDAHPLSNQAPRQATGYEWRFRFASPTPTLKQKLTHRVKYKIFTKLGETGSDSRTT